jgi:hypothetical protein
MSDATTTPSSGLLSRLAAAWRFLTRPAQADFAGISSAIDDTDENKDQKKQFKGEDGDFASQYRWMHY